VRTAARVSGARLAAAPCRPPQQQGGLFETGLRDPAAFWENLARVAAVVGEGRVGTPVGLDTHRPDACAVEKPAAIVLPPAAPPVHPPRGWVLRRWRPPRAVQVALAGARPVALAGAPVRGAVAAAQGPWRVSGDWWHPGAWAVELWQVELADGGRYQLAHTADGWAVEGELE
jgi:protein ImuB